MKNKIKAAQLFFKIGRNAHVAENLTFEFSPSGFVKINFLVWTPKRILKPLKFFPEEIKNNLPEEYQKKQFQCRIAEQSRKTPIGFKTELEFIET